MRKHYCIDDVIEPVQVNEAIKAFLNNNLSEMPEWFTSKLTNISVVKITDDYYKMSFSNNGCMSTLVYSGQIMFKKNGLIQSLDESRFNNQHKSITNNVT